MRVLVDMDGVITNLEGKFLECWREQHPEKMFIPLEQRTTFYIVDQYPQEWKSLIRQILWAPGFYRTQKPILYSIEALLEMQIMGIEVFICSSPLTIYQNCVLEKFEWIDEHLGNDWIKRIILTKDRTIIKADFLIDDRPKVEGIEENPSWEHIVYDTPYNRNGVKKKRLISWKNWKKTLSI